MPEPSDEFWSAFCSSGSLVVNCEQCGRVHFCTFDGPGDYEEGELEELRANAEKDPDKYMETSVYSSIQWGYILGKQTVWGCPCNEQTVYPYERFLLAHTEQIMTYFQECAKAELSKAERLMKKLNETLEATKRE